MEYDFRKLELEWQQRWIAEKIYKVSNDSPKPKYYVLDMFPYPSGAGLHVGHPLGYIASDIYSRYKRLKGFNVLHPMGFDSFGLPAEQYALETGQHPAETTKKNIATFKAQLDKIGFCYDWDREVRTSDPGYYKWTQWIFLKLFNSYFCNTQQKARPISDLIKKYETKGSKHFTAEEWNNYSKKEQEDILMKRRLAFSAYGEVNWCEALGTVLANDEVVNGVSERGGFPVVKKKMRQWYLRITAYADRLLKGLDTVDFSDSMKEMQRNWIGKSEGAEVAFRLTSSFSLTPGPSPEGEGRKTPFQTASIASWPILKEFSRENRKFDTVAEDMLWQRLRGNQLNAKVRRQHVIENFIIDFAFLNKKLLIELDGDYHEDAEQKIYDEARAAYLTELGYKVIRFSNEEVERNIESVVDRIQEALKNVAPLSPGRGAGGEAIKVYTTRPDTIFGVDFLVLAPEHELVAKITTPQQQQAIDEYLAYVKSRSDRERMAEVKQITGCFTGAYATNPFNGRQIPVWIAEYVLAGYGTGAIMAVPCGDQRDFLFAKHFNIPITNIIGEHFNGEEANPTKDAVLQNSGFMDGLLMKDAIEVAIKKIEEEEIGSRRINYRMRDAGFSRQRYWGEPFPIVWIDEVAVPLDESELPLELPHVDKYGPGPEGEGPLANLKEWASPPTPLRSAEKGEIQLSKKGAALVPKYSVKSPIQFEFAKQMRKEYTVAENLLWQKLRGGQLNMKFRRQHPIDAYVVDFVCLQETLIVEVDGEYHEVEDQKKYDEERSLVLENLGFKVLRFTNQEVQNNIDGVLREIKNAINRDSTQNSEFAGITTPSPLAERGLGVRETSTMPGYAGSSWYFLRYMDPKNNNTFCDRKASDYWNQVDVYIGGTEHAVGHLLYSRLWTKVLFDLNLIGFDEPFKKLVNQGMIQGSSRFVYRIEVLNVANDGDGPFFISYNLYSKWKSGEVNNVFVLELMNLSLPSFILEKDFEKAEIMISQLHVKVSIVDGVELDMDAFRKWKPEYTNAVFICEDGKLNTQLSFGEGLGVRSNDSKYICGVETEKMSKSKYNTVNPDDLVLKYGADTFRMYEMFLGPVEQSKPWDTKGIEGVHRFLKKLWRLFYDEVKGQVWNNEPASKEELKVLHRSIKKIEEDTERFSFNTAVSAFMILVNELADIKCHKKEVLDKVLILLAPYAPHIAEALWHHTGNESSVLNADYPAFDPQLLIETTKEYPVSINGKLRTSMVLSLDASAGDVEKMVVANDVVQKWLEGKEPKKIIFVKGKMINVVI